MYPFSNSVLPTCGAKEGEIMTFTARKTLVRHFCTTHGRSFQPHVIHLASNLLKLLDNPRGIETEQGKGLARMAIP